MESHSRGFKSQPAVGWVVGIIVFAIGVIGFEIAGEAIGAVSRIELDEPITVTRGSGRESWEEEVDTITTWYGQMTGLLSLTVAIWAGCAASTFRLDAGWKRKEWLVFRAWFTGLSILSLLGLLSELAFPTDPERWLQVLVNVVSLGLTALVALFCFQWWRAQTESLKGKPE